MISTRLKTRARLRGERRRVNVTGGEVDETETREKRSKKKRGAKDENSNQLNLSLGCRSPLGFARHIFFHAHASHFVVPSPSLSHKAR